MTTQTTAVPVSAKTLGTLFEFTYSVFRRNTDGVTHTESLRIPQPTANCINWVGGHVVATRDNLLGLLGQAPVFTPAETETYKRGAPPLTDPSKAMAWDRIVAALDMSQERLRAGLASITPEQLVAPMPADKNPFGVDSMGDMIAVFSFHDGYHVGQLGVLRRLCGKPGAVK
jgi:hypothetical protein